MCAAWRAANRPPIRRSAWRHLPFVRLSPRMPGASVSAMSYERRGSAAWIRLTRPEKRNAITPEVLADIAAGLERARDEGARSVVLTGSGAAFCAGADLS